MVASAQSCFTFLAAGRESAARQRATFGSLLDYRPHPTFTALLPHRPKNRVWGFSGNPSGRLSRRGRGRSINTPGSRGCAYKTASGRHEWPNRDPMSELNDINLYRFVYNNANFWIDPFGLECQFSVGIGGTLGGGANGGFGLFGGGGMSLGFTTSGQLFVQFQAAGMGGSGVYAGVGVQGSISHSDTPTPGGISTQEALHAEINADDLVGGGYSTDQNKDSRGMSFPIPHVRVAVGLGAMAGLGQSTTTTIATPPLGQYFPPMQGTIYTPVTNVNAPPNVVTAPCNCNH